MNTTEPNSCDLSIDPSVNKCGWCIAENAGGQIVDWMGGTIEPEGRGIIWKSQDLFEQLRDELNGCLIRHLVIEWPMFYGGAKGQMAAQQGYTIDLAAIAMYVAGRLLVPHKDIYLYTAPQWKGMVPKVKTLAMFKAMFGEAAAEGLDDNAIDARMMLVHHLRKTCNSCK